MKKNIVATRQLAMAIERGEVFDCWQPVHDKADVNAILDSGFSVLQSAAYSTKARVEIVNFLIGCGADVNLMGDKGDSALALAVARDERVIFHALVSAGAGLEQRRSPEGQTALGSAAYNGRPELFRYLVEMGADLNAAHRLVGGDVFTPLQIAARMGELEIVRYCLVDLGMDPNCKTQKGRSLGQLAAKHDEIKELVMACKTEWAIKEGASHEGACDGPRRGRSGPSL